MMINNVLKDRELSDESMKRFLNGFCQMLNQPVSEEKVDEILLKVKEKHGLTELNEMDFHHVKELLRDCGVDVDCLDKSKVKELKESNASYNVSTFTVDSFHLQELADHISTQLDFEEWKNKMNPEVKTDLEDNPPQPQIEKRTLTKLSEDLEINSESLENMLEPSSILDFQAFKQQKNQTSKD
jgi:hypothetical protein